MRALVALASFVTLLGTGCSSSPDVVASQNSDIYFTVPLVHDCKAGHYQGFFSTFSGMDGGANFQLSGIIGFALVLSPQGEFLDLQQSAPLTGTSDVPIPGGTITADLVEKEPCRDGRIDTDFQNGTYQAGSLTIHFEGGSSGTYYSDQRAFSGQWNAQLASGTVLIGSWTAVWVGP